jgi:hypothetical protein
MKHDAGALPALTDNEQRNPRIGAAVIERRDPELPALADEQRQGGENQTTLAAPLLRGQMQQRRANQIYLHADPAPQGTKHSRHRPPSTTLGRYRLADQLLAFLESL